MKMDPSIKNMSPKAFFRPLCWAAIAAAGLVLSGCGNRDSDLSQWIAQVKQRPPAPLDPIPTVPEFDKFTYQDHALRDPFMPLENAKGDTAEVKVDTGPKPDPNRVKEPLEDFSLDSLRMVGTIGDGAGAIALVKDPTGVIDQVSIGQHMGKQDGRIITIEGKRIILVELVSNGRGGWEESQATLNLTETKVK